VAGIIFFTLYFYLILFLGRRGIDLRALEYKRAKLNL